VTIVQVERFLQMHLGDESWTERCTHRLREQDHFPSGKEHA